MQENVCFSENLKQIKMLVSFNKETEFFFF